MREKLAFVDHSFHKKFKSSQFFKDLLETRYKVVEFWDKKWQGGSGVNYQAIKSGNFSIIVFWQILPSIPVLQKLTPSRLVWIPMYDTETKKRPTLIDYAPYLGLGLKVICFSQTLFKKINRAGLESYCYKYQPRPSNQPAAMKENRVFFWQRTSDVTWQTLKKLFKPDDIDHLTLKLTPDPNYAASYPSLIDKYRYSISLIERWLKKDEYHHQLNSSNIFVAPRLNEGIGLAFLEALAAGMLLIAPDRPTMNEYITHNKTGFLFDPTNPKPLDLSEIQPIAKASFLQAKRNYLAWENSKSKIFKDIEQPSKKFSSKRALRFSIVTPSYNQGKYIRQTIESVLSQAGNFFIDYLVADGGSTDQTITIIKEYEKKLIDKHYKLKCRGITFDWWSKPDKGQADAINQGFRQARGEILAWINSDDYYQPDSFSYIAAVFNRLPTADLVYGDCQEINQITNESRVLPAVPTSFDELIRFGGNAIPQPSAFFSKKILKKVNYLDASLRYSLDYELFVKIAKSGGKLIHNPGKTLATLRLWKASKSVAQIKNFKKERRIVRLRYGGSVIDIKEILKFSGRSRTLKYIYKRYPTLFWVGKKIFFFVFYRLNYPRTRH